MKTFHLQKKVLFNEISVERGLKSPLFIQPLYNICFTVQLQLANKVKQP